MDTDEFNDIANSGKDDEDVTPSRKRRKLSEPLSDLSDDSEDNYKPNQEMSDSDSISSGVNEDEISEPESEEPLPSPVKNKKSKRSSTFKQEKTPKTQQKLLSFNTPQNKGNNQTNLTPSQKGNISVSTNTKAKLSLFSAASVEDKNQGDQSSDGKIWTHLTYDWLQDGKRKDKERRSQDHPDYNPRTIYIPDFAKKAMTPVGKFYELYHQDAVIAVNELGLLYMRGEYAHSGFPEIAFSRYANMLIGKGYKIARTEQTETPAMMEARCKKLSSTTKFDKVVRREICRILSKGARTCSFIDGNVNDYSSCYLLAIKETICEKSMGDETVFGVCFIDTTIGKFHLLLERRNLSCSSLQVLETNLSSVSKDFLTPGCEFWQSKKTLKFLNEIRPFCEEENCDKNCFPGTLQAMLEKASFQAHIIIYLDDVIGLTPVSEKDLAIQALGACIWYLQTCCIEQELLSMKCFEEYFPIDKVSNVVSQNVEVALNKHMVLDGITLQNLDILENGSTGKRLMRHWLCSPVCNPKAVEDRLNAVEDLMEIPEIVDNAKELLKKLPDLERLLSKGYGMSARCLRDIWNETNFVFISASLGELKLKPSWIHTQGSADRSKDHPESRAIFFEETIYSKRKIMDFISALDGYKVSLEIIKEFNKSHAKLRSTLLKKCICYPSEDGKFPELEKHLIFFDVSLTTVPSSCIHKVVLLVFISSKLNIM
ncbi:DNA mismatch repair protein Msh6 [Nymphon striatum]|nr:DNA mismatch repair protein Msh6 [Nymphon striatum]